MNRVPKASKFSKRSEGGSREDRELFVISDFSSIPAMELRPLQSTFGEWIGAIIRYKLKRVKTEPAFVVECRRLVPARHVPKRIRKYFDQLSAELTRFGFVEAFEATVGAIGPHSSAILGMSHSDGEIHFFATQVVTRVEGKIHDDAYFGFVSWLRDGISVLTLSTTQLASPRRGVDRLIANSEKPSEVIRKHRERLQHQKPIAIAPEDYFEQFAADYQEQADDWLARGVIRRATPPEVTRIRNEM